MAQLSVWKKKKKKKRSDKKKERRQEFCAGTRYVADFIPDGSSNLGVIPTTIDRCVFEEAKCTRDNVFFFFFLRT